MASQDDVRRIALSLPATSEAEGRYAFSVLNKGKQKGFVWVWAERVHPKKARVPNPAVVAIRVADQLEKELILRSDERKFFTEPHYEGFPAILVRLAELDVAELEEMVTNAWRYQAPRELREAFDRSARALLARIRTAQLDAAYRTGDFADVEHLIEEARQAAAAASDRGAEAEAIDQWGELAYRRLAQMSPEERRPADIAAAQDAFEQALAIRRELGDAEGAAESLFHLGRLAQVLRGDHANAFRLLRQALPVTANSVLLGDVHLHLGVHVQHWGDGPAAALHHLEEAVQRWRAQGEAGLLVVALVTLAWCELRVDRTERALTHAREALDLARRSGLRERYTRRAETVVSAAERALGEGRLEPMDPP